VSHSVLTDGDPDEPEPTGDEEHDQIDCEVEKTITAIATRHDDAPYRMKKNEKRLRVYLAGYVHCY
jgi:hypothetical protein